MKSLKKYWWVILVLLVGYVVLNKKLLIRLGIKIGYKSGADGIKYQLKKVGNVINVYSGSTIVGQVVKVSNVIYFKEATELTEVTNSQDLKFFSALLK